MQRDLAKRNPAGLGGDGGVAGSDFQNEHEKNQYHTVRTATTKPDTFTRDRFRWLDQVAADRQLHPRDFKVAYIISTYVNRITGDAFPSQAAIVVGVGGSLRSVQYSLLKLHKHGHLNIDSGRGRHNVSHYRPRLWKSAPDAAATSVSKQNSQEFADFNPNYVQPVADNFQSDVQPAATFVSENEQNAERKYANSCGRNSPKNSLKSENGSLFPGESSKQESLIHSSEQLRVKKISEIDTAFSEFWEAYPRHEGKKASQIKFKRIIAAREGTPEQLIAGARRYALTVSDRERKYVKLPMTWLSQGCWEDELLAPETRRQDRAHHQRQSATEYVVGTLADDLE